MTRNILRFFTVCAPALLLIACGSSSSGGSGGAATTGTTTDTSTGTGGNAGTGGTTGTGGTVATGACTDAADQAIITDPTKDVAGAAGDCGKNNIAAPDSVKQKCLTDATGISDPCAVCFVGIINCAIQKCLTQCISDSNSPDCVSCRKTNCEPAFVTCSGLPPS